MLRSSKKSVHNYGGLKESKKPNNGLAENAYIGPPGMIDLDAALPPSGAASNITSQNTLASAATEFPQENQGWNTAAIPPLNKR